MSQNVLQPQVKRARLDCENDKNRDRQKLKNGTQADMNVDARHGDALLNVISSEIMTNYEAIAADYSSATPFPHSVLHNVTVDGFLDNLLEELKQNSKVKFKESDLFRVYQSVDFGNLTDSSPLALKMPSLMKLREALYSKHFRSFMERIADLEPGTLTDKVDCAENCHTKGCHLLCHDDVIGTRKLSFILYLTDREPLWSDENGGCLELYQSMEQEFSTTSDSVNGRKNNASSVKKRVPGPFPVKKILPHFNSMAYFEVRPGCSFHSVQEVFCDKPRLSIQGWYHAKKTPFQIENSTLCRLKSTDMGEDTEGDFTPLNERGSSLVDEKDLSESDITYLLNYINATYLEKKSIETVQARFEEESSVQLRHFLNEKWAAKVKKATAFIDGAENVGRDRPALNYDIGVSDDWLPVGPAHKQRFLEYIGKENSKSKSAGSLLSHIKCALLESAAFGRLLNVLTSLGRPLGQRGRIRRFRPGLDYTVAHYGILTKKPVLDATMCFVAGTGDQCKRDMETGELEGFEDDALWESGDVGGFECYVAADDEDEKKNEAADEYDENDDSELLSVAASDNTLSLVYRDPGTMRFVKYVGSGAPSSRWDLCLEYQVADSDDSKPC